MLDTVTVHPTGDKRATLKATLVLGALAGMVATVWYGVFDIPTPSATECRHIFDVAINGKRQVQAVNWSRKGEVCAEAGLFEPLLPSAQTRYTITGRALALEDAVHSLDGAVIRKSRYEYRRFGVSLPAVDVIGPAKTV